MTDKDKDQEAKDQVAELEELLRKQRQVYGDYMWKERRALVHHKLKGMPSGKLFKHES